MLFGLVFISCSKPKEYKSDEVNSVDRKASIETEISVKNDSAVDILVTKHKVWKNDKLAKEIITYDTIPSLGDTLQTTTDSNGNEVTGKARKDYEFYITVQ